MKQITSLIRTMPMNSPSRSPNNITNIQFLRFATLIANPARSCSDFENLSILMMMPMGSGTGSEHDVVDGDSFLFVCKDGIGPDVAGEGGASQFGLFARCTGIADNCHRHI